MPGYLARELARIIKEASSKEQAVFDVVDFLNASYFLIEASDCDEFDYDELYNCDKLADDLVEQIVFAQQENS